MIAKKHKGPEVSRITTGSEVTKKREDPIAYTIKETNSELARVATLMKKIVEENSNTKREMKEAVLRLGKLVDGLGRVSVRDWVENHRWVKVEIPVSHVDTQTEKEESKTRETETQTPESNRSVEQETKPKVVKGEMLDEAAVNGYKLEILEEFIGLKWPKEEFISVTEEREPMDALPNEWDMAVLVTGDFAMEEGTKRFLRDRYRGIEQLMGQNVEVGSATMLTDCVRIPGREGGITILKRNVFYGVVGENHLDVPNFPDMFKSIMSIKELMQREGRGKIAISMDGVNTGIAKKLLEYIFRKSDMEVKLMIDRDVPGGGRTVEKRPPRKRKDAILIRVDKGKKYAEVLKEVKGNVDLRKTGAEDVETRMTRAGDLLLSIRRAKAEDAVDTLREAITKGAPGLLTEVMKEPKTVIHVLGLDGDTERMEVEAAVREAVPGGVNMVMEVSEMWPAFGGSVNTAVTLPRSEAESLIKIGKIKVGWAIAKIREKIILKTCRKCWRIGHEAKYCKGESMSMRCRRCTGVGHQEKECKGQICCYECGETGHRGGTSRCHAFREALSEERKRRAGNQP